MTKTIKLIVTFVGLGMIALPAQAYEKGDWIFRAGVGTVDPESTAYSHATDNVVIKIKSGTAVTMTGAYFLSQNWSFEVLAATPFSHDVKLGSVTPGGDAVKIGKVKHLPPTFSFQYHFMPDAAFRPYVGFGLNYTTFFSGSLDQTLLPGIDLSVDDSFGVAAQLAADVKLSDQWLLNFDARWISIKADATLSDGIDSETFELDINPLVYSINVGYIF